MLLSCFILLWLTDLVFKYLYVIYRLYFLWISVLNYLAHVDIFLVYIFIIMNSSKTVIHCIFILCGVSVPVARSVVSVDAYTTVFLFDQVIPASCQSVYVNVGHVYNICYLWFSESDILECCIGHWFYQNKSVKKKLCCYTKVQVTLWADTDLDFQLELWWILMIFLFSVSELSILLM